jgi:hypothetical protein
MSPSWDSAHSLGIGRVAYQVAHSILLEPPIRCNSINFAKFFGLNFTNKKLHKKRKKKEQKRNKTLEGSKK